MSQIVFPDNTVLCNFAAVHRLDLLRDWLRGRGRWTDAVAHEANLSARYLPDLRTLETEGWLGIPIEIVDATAIEAVERKRRIVFGGSVAEPRKHLGEAQTCYLLAEDAFEHAVDLGIQAYRTIDIMRHIVADGDLTSVQAFGIMQAMTTRQRSLFVPPTHRDL